MCSEDATIELNSESTADTHSDVESLSSDLTTHSTHEVTTMPTKKHPMAGLTISTRRIRKELGAKSAESGRNDARGYATTTCLRDLKCSFETFVHNERNHPHWRGNVVVTYPDLDAAKLKQYLREHHDTVADYRWGKGQWPTNGTDLIISTVRPDGKLTHAAPDGVELCGTNDEDDEIDDVRGLTRETDDETHILPDPDEGIDRRKRDWAGKWKRHYHPVVELYPFDKDTFVWLTADMRLNGYDVTHAIDLLDGLIVDGRHRYKAAEAAGIEPMYNHLPPGTDAVAHACRANAMRRPLPIGARTLVAARQYETLKAEKFVPPDGIKLIKHVAAEFRVANGSISIAQQIIRTGCPQLIAAINSGNIGIKTAARLTNLSQDEQRAALCGEAAAPPAPKKKPIPPGSVTRGTLVAKTAARTTKATSDAVPANVIEDEDEDVGTDDEADGGNASTIDAPQDNATLGNTIVGLIERISILVDDAEATLDVISKAIDARRADMSAHRCSS